MENENSIDQNLPETNESSQPEDIFADLDTKDKEMIRLILERKGITNQEIAKAMGMSRQMISKRKNKLKFQKALENALKPALDLLVEAQPLAAKTIILLLKSKDEKIRLGACKEVLKGVLSENMNLNIMDKSGLRRFLESLTEEEFKYLADED